MKEVGVLTKNWRIFLSKRRIDSTQSGMESGIFSPAYHTKFHSRTKNSTLYGTFILYSTFAYMAKSWSSICTAAPHLWHFVAPHNDAADGDKIDAKAEDESESGDEENTTDVSR